MSEKEDISNSGEEKEEKILIKRLESLGWALF